MNLVHDALKGRVLAHLHSGGAQRHRPVGHAGPAALPTAALRRGRNPVFMAVHAVSAPAELVNGPLKHRPYFSRQRDTHLRYINTEKVIESRLEVDGSTRKFRVLVSRTQP